MLHTYVAQGLQQFAAQGLQTCCTGPANMQQWACILAARSLFSSCSGPAFWMECRCEEMFCFGQIWSENVMGLGTLAELKTTL